VKKTILLLAVILGCYVPHLSAQNDRDNFHNQFTEAILHINTLQDFLEKGVEQMKATAPPLGYEYAEVNQGLYHVWFLNREHDYEEPTLILHYDTASKQLRYFSSNPSLFDYLLRDLPQNGYREFTDGEWENGVYGLFTDEHPFDWNHDNNPEDFQYLTLYKISIFDEDIKTSVMNLFVEGYLEKTLEDVISATSSGESESDLIRKCRQDAEHGDANAQCLLGYLYEKGYGLTQDNSEAARWYRKAADQGESTALYALGHLYQYGKGVPKDEETAKSWYRKAAEQGFEVAEYILTRLDRSR
jgi:hypothetical protein